MFSLSHIPQALETASVASNVANVIMSVDRAHPEVRSDKHAPWWLLIALQRVELVCLGEVRRPSIPTRRRSRPRKSRATAPTSAVTVVYTPPPPKRWDADSCRSLLVMLLRRAACDWVLYRTHTELSKREKADAAYHWIFIEVPGSHAWRERIKSNKQLTSFLSICEIMGIDPNKTREAIRKMTVADVLKSGRPAESRHVSGSVDYLPDEYSVHGYDILALP